MRFDRLADLRIARNLTQANLAERLGFSQQAVQSWECGYRTPPLDKLITIADFFGVSLDYLLGRDTSKIDPPPVEERANESDNAMPSDVKELKSLITQIVDQALDKRLPPSGRQ